MSKKTQKPQSNIGAVIVRLFILLILWLLLYTLWINGLGDATEKDAIFCGLAMLNIFWLSRFRKWFFNVL